MSYLKEYIDKIAKFPIQELYIEQQNLIAKFNKIFECDFIVFAASLEKGGYIDISMNNTDYEIIYDILKNKSGECIYVYIETPGGSGQAASDIANLLHEKFKEVNFVISGEAKSAGTILALSGDEIWMTKSGSLGPIDAQVKVGRSVVSAHNYKRWVERVKAEALTNGRLNPFDAQMAAQISPGELEHIYNSLSFATDLVIEWLPKYKFKNWKQTDTNGNTVTEDMRKQRAAEIALELTNQDKWKSHGRSLKIEDLDQIGLKIKSIDSNELMADIIYRIQSLNRVLFGSTSTYKMFVTDDNRIGQNALEKGRVSPKMPETKTSQSDWVVLEAACVCGQIYKIYLKFIPNSDIDVQLQKQGCLPFPKDGKLACPCGEVLDLTGAKAQIENEMGRPALL